MAPPTLADYIDLLRRSKKTLLIGGLIGALFCSWLALDRPIMYIAKATFRDWGVSSSHGSLSLLDNLISDRSQESAASAVLHSRMLLTRAAEKTHFQASISALDSPPPPFFSLYRHLLAEYAFWTNQKIPLVPEPSSPLQVTQLTYEGMVPQDLILRALSSSDFSVERPDGSLVGKASLGNVFIFPEGSFTLATREPISAESRFNIHLEPLHEVLKTLTGLLLVESDRDDKTLVKITFRYPHRSLAIEFVNVLMQQYQAHLEEEHDRIADAKLRYLRRRQEEVGNNLAQLMENFVEHASHASALSGFTSLDREMEFLSNHLTQGQQRLTELDLEVKRLASVDIDRCAYYDAYTSRGDPHIINSLLAQLRQLQQQSDLLALSLQENYPQEALTARLDKLALIEGCLKESNALYTWLVGTRKEPVALKYLASSQYPIAAWYQTLQDKQQEGLNTEPFKEQFLSHLKSFDRLLKIQYHTLSQPLENGYGEPLSGLSREAAIQLTAEYLRELNRLEAQEKQQRFALEQFEDPLFEISSLTALLQDPVSAAQIRKATDLIVQAKDADNHSQRELTRFQDELELQKRFLSAHIAYMADLLQIQQQLLHQKIYALQTLTLELTHQEISLVKSHAQEFISHRLEHLSRERELLTEQHKEMQHKLALIPSRWAAEQLLQQQLSLNQRCLENLSSMVESKNIAKNLELVQSLPLDHAFTPIHPKPPQLILYATLGGFLGLLGAACSLLAGATFRHQFPLSPESCQKEGLIYAGVLSRFQGDVHTATLPLLHRDLETLRTLLQAAQKEKKLLLVTEGGPNCLYTLATLIAKRQERAITLSLAFDQEVPIQEAPKGTLIDYLEGQIDLPHITRSEAFDYILPGGPCRYGPELLTTPRFTALLEGLGQRYDWILVSTPSAALSPQVTQLALLFSSLAIMANACDLGKLIQLRQKLPNNQILVTVSS